MLHRRSTARWAVALLAATLTLAPAASAAGPEAGSVQLARAAESDFDRHTQSPSPSAQAFMRDHFWRMRTYAPYFDSRTAWYSNAWTYRNLYAIYRGSDLADQHPEWILRDEQGRKLYIPFDCGGGSCPQYAGDIGDPAFRAHWIAEATEQVARYRGLFIDDVNLEPRVANGQGDTVMPLDERTGRIMTAADWSRYMAEFTEEIRAAIPSKEIVHNALWFAGHDKDAPRRELSAATHVEIERGVNDPGLTGGSGQFGYETLLSHIDWLHARGKGVILDSFADTQQEVEYELASYFLIATGRDGLGSGWRSAPDDWWAGYDVQLGAPRGERREWRGLLRRDFERGYVLVNQPGEPQRSVQLGAGASDPAGAPRSSISLGAAQGAVVVTDAARPGSSGRVRTRTRVRPVPNPRLRQTGTARAAGLSADSRLQGSALIEGRVQRAPRGSRVVLRLERHAAGRWTREHTSRHKIGRGGRFARLFRGLNPGRYRVVAVYPGSRRAHGSTAARGFSLQR
jgi:hypothetical protein